MKTNNKKENSGTADHQLLPKMNLVSVDEASELAENILNTVREPLLLLDEELRVVKASRSFFNFFKVSSDETIGTLIYDLGNHQWNIPKLKELLEAVLPEKTTFDNYEVEHDFSTIGKRTMLLNARQIGRAFGIEKIILLAFEDITEGKRVNESVNEYVTETGRVTNEYLHILFNHAYAPIIIWDPSLVITHINSAFEKLSGYRWNELRDKKIDMLFPENQIDKTLVLIENTIISDDRSEPIEIDILTKNKDIRTVLWNPANVYDKEGKRIISTIVQDITSRKNTEKALSIFEIRYRRLFESAKDGILILDAETGNIIDVNPFLIELLGYSKEQLFGKEIWKIGFFNDIAANKKKFLELQQKEYVRYEDLPLETADGRKINVEFVSNVYLVNHNKVIQCNIRDITKRKLAEKSLQVSEVKYRNLIDNMNDGIFISDEKGIVQFANDALARIHGFDNYNELLNKSFLEFAEPSVKNEILKNFEEELNSGKRAHEVEMPIVSADGSIVYVLIKPSVIRDGQKITGVSGIVRDITERKSAELRQEKLLNTLTARVKEMSCLNAINEICQKNTLTIYEILQRTVEAIPFGFQHSAVTNARIRLHEFEVCTNNCKETKWFLQEFFHYTESNRGVIEVFYTEQMPFREIGPFISEEQNLIKNIASILSETIKRRNAETSLKESEDKFFAITKAAQDAIIMTDDKGRVVYFNNTAERIFGYTEKELTGLPLHEFIVPERYEQQYIAEMKTFSKTGESAAVGNIIEVMAKKKDGSEFPAELSLSGVQMKGFWHGVGLIRDITERKLAEKGLVESEEKFRSFFENSIDAILLTSPDGNIFSANPAACMMFGYSEEELIKLGKNGIVDMTDPQLPILISERALKGKAQGELTFIRRDGTHFPADISSAVFKNQKGVERTSMIIRDITERKLAVATLRENEASLRNAQEIAKMGSWEYDIVNNKTNGFPPIGRHRK